MIRLLVADRWPLVREDLKSVVGKYPDMKVVGEAADGNEVLARVATTKVDVVLLDTSLPGPGFLETLGHLHTERPDLPVLALSIHPEDHHAIRALKTGAVGYLTKDCSPETLAEAIRRVYQGRRYVNSSVAERLVSALGQEVIGEPHEVLSNREFQVLCKLGSGLSVKETAFDLGLSPKTVSTFRTRILKKMRLATTSQLVHYAVVNKLVDS